MRSLGKTVDAFRSTAPHADLIGVFEIAELKAKTRFMVGVTDVGLHLLPEGRRNMELTDVPFLTMTTARLQLISVRLGRQLVVTTGTDVVLTFQAHSRHLQALCQAIDAAGVVIHVDENAGFPERPDETAPAEAKSTVAVVTTDSLPGQRIVEVFGLVTGATVRSRDALADIGSNLKSVVGGELRGATKLVLASRAQARARMEDRARDMGANAVVGFRFDVESLGSGGSQSAATIAYGTAVRVAAEPPPKP